MKVDIDAWASISKLKPQLRSHVQFYQHCYRGQLWHILADTLSSAHFRCTEQVFRFIQFLDGEHTVEQAYQRCIELADDSRREARGSVNGNKAPETADILKVIATLQMKDMLQGDMPVLASELYLRSQKQKREERIRKWSRPLSFKLSLWDPDHWLEKARPVLDGLFKRWILLIAFALVCLGSVFAYVFWPELVQHFSMRFVSPQNLLLVWLVYPFVKFLHELGHAIAAKHWGAEIHDMGLLFIVFIPVPYVDASSSHRFSNKHHRMMVSAAGIFIELLLAALALLLWTVTEEGFVRDIAFNIAVVGGLSTLFVNGNPLLRFDGYYVFSDAIEIPNLAGRSTQYLAYLSQRFLLGVDGLVSPVCARGERPWLFFYGLAAGLYRVFISFVIAFYVASHFFIVGVMLALWSLVQQIVWPFISAIKKLVVLAKQQKRLRRLAFTSVILGGLIALVLFYPLHSSSHIQGIVALPEIATIRAESSGFMHQVMIENGVQVKAGDALFVLENPELQSKEQLIKLQIQELRARESEAYLNDALSSQIYKVEIHQAEKNLADIQQQAANLLIDSPVSGTFSVKNTRDMPGRYYRKGEVLAYVIDLSGITVNAVMPQQKFKQLNLNAGEWRAKLYSQPDLTFQVFTGREVPRASFKLPSEKLGSASGGDILVDARDPEGLTTLEAVYQLELTIPNYTQNYLAARVEVKTWHQAEALGIMIYRKFRRFLQNNFQL